MPSAKPSVWQKLRPLAAAIAPFYSWHFSFPIGRRCVVVIVPDSGWFTIVASLIFTYFLIPAPILIVGGFVAAVVLSPLFVWQTVIIAPRSTWIVRTLFLAPCWLTRVPAEVRAEFDDAWEDPAPTGVCFDLGDDSAMVGNGWNAKTLLAQVSSAEDRVRSNTSLERTHER
jgi:hypothetical protein